ncbi:MAG: hypothetical protein WDN25_00080 [Acetobacteraceae bacterium]
MSGDTEALPPSDHDIIQGDGAAFIVGVPDTAQTQFVSYLRLGHASTDETDLQEDPAATGTSPTLISNAGTASPFANGALDYTTGTMQLVAPYGYVRVGTASAYEAWLPAIPSTAPDTPTAFAPANAGPSYPEGVLLYSNSAINLAAPAISQTTSEYSRFSGDSLSVVHDGKVAVSSTYTTPAFPFTSTYQILNEMNVTVGAVSNMITGNNLTYWQGNDASTGVGSLLWSNFGTTQNVFGGQIVNIINSSIDVQGLGESKLQEAYGLDVTTSIDLLVSPVVVSSQASTALLASQFRANLVVVASIVEAAGVLLTTMQTGITSDVVKNSKAMRDLMIAQYAELSTVTAVVVVMQALAVLAGLKSQVAAEAAKAGATAKISMIDGQLTLSAGGTALILSPLGMRVNTAGAIELASTTVDTNAPAIGFSAGL